jgi:hypothetical protein
MNAIKNTKLNSYKAILNQSLGHALNLIRLIQTTQQIGQKLENIVEKSLWFGQL